MPDMAQILHIGLAAGELAGDVHARQVHSQGAAWTWAHGRIGPRLHMQRQARGQLAIAQGPAVRRLHLAIAGGGQAVGREAPARGGGLDQQHPHIGQRRVEGMAGPCRYPASSDCQR